MYTQLSASRSFLYSVARACDAGHANRKDCAAIILYCAETATNMALDAIQILGNRFFVKYITVDDYRMGFSGGNGYINDYPTGRILRDAKLYEIGAGTSEIRRMVIARAITDEYS